MSIKQLMAAIVFTCSVSSTQAGLIISPLAVDLPSSSYTSSAQYLGYSAENAFNGTGSWNAGGYISAWIEADMGSTQTLTQIKLTVAQLPNGTTDHKVFLSDNPIGNNSAALTPIYTHYGYTVTGQVLDILFDTPQTGRYLQILSNNAPARSWTALGEDTQGRIDWEQASVPAVPVPPAVWLFGSGLIGLVGIARRRDPV